MLYYKKYVLDENKDWVVFIHGIGGSSAIFFKQLREYREKYNVLLIDLRGHGKSKENLRPINKYTIEELSKDVIEVIDNLKLKSVHFVGISLGTIIIRAIMYLRPDIVKSAVLGGAITRFNQVATALIHIVTLFINFIPYMPLYRFAAWVLMPKERHKQSREAFVSQAVKLGQKEFIKWFGIAKQVKSLYNKSKNKLNNIPILYLMGEDDYMFLGLTQEDYKKENKAKLVIINECGHVCNIDKPNEFNKISIDFIDDVILNTKVNVNAVPMNT